MKASNTIAAAAAVLALAAPAANASLDRAVPTRAPHAKKAPKHRTGVVIVIVSTVTPAVPQPAYDATLDCANTGNNCTNEQLCVIWGMNCDLMSPGQPADTASEDQNPTA